MSLIKEITTEQRFYLLAMAASTQAIIILDTEGHIVEWNPGAEHLLGWSSNEALGQHSALIFTSEDQAAGEHQAELENARRYGQAADVRWHIRKDGSRFYADGVLYAMYGAEGTLVGFGKIVKEAQSPFGRRMSERKHELAAEREFLAAVLNSIEDAVVACNAEGRLTLFNRTTREFHGLPEVSLSPEKWGEHYDLYEANGMTPLKTKDIPLFRALSGETIRHVQMVIAPKNGKRRTVLASGQPLLNQDGEKLGAVVSMHDITDQREMQLARDIAIQEQARRAEAEAATNRARQSEELLQFALKTAAMAAWDWNLVTGQIMRIGTANVLHSLVSGPAQDFLKMAHPDDQEWLLASIEKAKNGEIPYDFEYRVKAGREGMQWVADKALMRTDATDGQPHLTGVLINITRRKQAEERLQLLDALSQVTRLASDPTSIMRQTTKMLGEYLHTTRCAYADFEGDNNQFTIREDWTAPGAASSAGKYCLDLFGPKISTYMREGRTLVIHDLETERDLGQGFENLRALDIKAIICFPLVKEGQLLAMMAVHQDIPRNWTSEEIALVEEVVERSWAHIERVRAADALHKREAHLSSLFEQTVAGLVETDLDDRIVNVNKGFCQILCCRPEDVLGKRIYDVTHPEDVDASIRQFRKSLEKGESYEIEKRYLRADGSVVWARVAVTPIRAAEGESIDKILRVVLDITDRKRAEEELRKADRRKDEFLAMLAHELRNPLAPIASAAELLRLGRLDAARVQQTSTIISRQVKHMTGLVDDLLDVSRVTRGLITLEKIKLDAKRVVADAVEQVRPMVEARGHHLTIHTPPMSAYILGDQKRLVQVLTNLLNNAAKYTPEGGSITLSMEVDGDHVKMAVADNGIGMTEDMVQRAFELFAQAERTSDRSQGGLGIGLALVKSLVELHGGSVTAYSEGLGKGSRFTVCLPHLIEPSSVSGNEQAVLAFSAPNQALKVMIVDDNVDAAQMLAMFIEALGHHVIVEHSSRKALERARTERPEVYLLDIGLPDMDGNELARCLRSEPQTAGAKIIAITGYGQEQDRDRALRSGFDHHFVKPPDITRLAALLQDSGTS